jgi:LPPG:FO 2-phospho-L-lactate transferase
MAELGIATDPTALARHYAGLIDGLVIDHEDARWEQSCGMPVMVTSTVMNSLADRERLAQETVEFAQQLRPMSSRRTA